MQPMIVVHVTHEAVEKIGGIGAVISGLATADAYGERVSRTILLGPVTLHTSGGTPPTTKKFCKKADCR